jgi:hypothetical protein
MMASIYGRFEYDDDSLTPGKSDDGGLSQLLFDSEGKLVDHATFFPENENDSSEEPTYTESSAPGDQDDGGDAGALLVLAVLAASTAVAIGGYVAVRKAAPHIQRLVNERALPAVKSFWNQVRGQKSGSLPPESVHHEVAEMPMLIVDEATPGTDLANLKPVMSAEEWYARFRAMVSGMSIAEEQWRVLSSVQVPDDEAVQALQSQMAQQSPLEVMEQVTLMIEATAVSDDELNDEGDTREPLHVEASHDEGRLHQFPEN